MRRAALLYGFMLVLTGAVSAPVVAQTDAAGAKEAADLVATQVREQGYDCKDPVKAERDAQASTPDETMWNLTCKSTSYRVRLVPDMAAQIEQTD